MVRLQDASLVLRASWAAQSIITAVCADADDKDAVLDALLKPRYGWPQYVRVDGEDKDKGKAAVEGTSGQPETLSELAYVLGLQLGFNAILYESDGQNRHACMHACSSEVSFAIPTAACIGSLLGTTSLQRSHIQEKSSLRCG